MLRAEFQLICTHGFSWTQYVFEDRGFRSKFSVGIPYQCLSMFGLRARYFCHGYAKLTSFWKRLEVRRGCGTELLMLVSYGMKELMDVNSGWWAVAYT